MKSSHRSRVRFIEVTIIGALVLVTASSLWTPTPITLAKIDGIPLAFGRESGDSYVVDASGHVLKMQRGRGSITLANGPSSLTAAIFERSDEGIRLFVGDVHGAVFKMETVGKTAFVRCETGLPRPITSLRRVYRNGKKLIVCESDDAIMELDGGCVPQYTFKRIERSTASQGAALLEDIVFTIGGSSSGIMVDRRSNLNGRFSEINLGPLVGGASCICESSDGVGAIVGTTAGYLLYIGGIDPKVIWEHRIYTVPLFDIFSLETNGVVVTSSFDGEIVACAAQSSGITVLARRKCGMRLTAAGSASNSAREVMLGFEDGTIESWRIK